MLDGELYVHGWSLQKINGVASINALTDSEQTLLLQYHVFDIINTEALEEPFAERAEYLAAFRRRIDLPLVFVDTHLVPDQIRGDALYSTWKHFGYEGAVYKDPAEPYGFAEHCGNKENRWKKTLKRKDYLDLVARCVGMIPGEGKYEGAVGSLVFQMDNGVRFCAGSGLSDFEREEWYDSPPLERYFSLKYFALSDAGLPLQPSILSPL
jgi:DNA ligase-1